jgi:concanavalin A-like lectin/glucanase superfamily protein
MGGRPGSSDESQTIGAFAGASSAGGTGAVPAAGGSASLPLDAGSDAGAGDGSASPPGCSAAQSDACAALAALLSHRYRFEGTGTTARDSVGDADGVLRGTQLSGDGSVALAAGAPYVDLPNGIVSGLASATFEAWLTWGGGDEWQRIFDFGGTNDGAEDEPSSGSSYLFVTPRAASGNLRVALRTRETNGELVIDAGRPLPAGVQSQVVVVVNAPAQLLSLYLDGELLGSVAFTTRLALIDDVNNWLGRSQFDDDAPLAGALQDVRIYAGALAPAQVQLSFERGADATLGD